MAAKAFLVCYSIYEQHAICYCLSVRLSVTRADHSESQNS